MTKQTRLWAALPLLLLAASCGILPFGGSGSTNGVMKSSDSGDSFDVANKLAGEKSGFITGVSAARIRIDPSSSDNLFIASPTNGSYFSGDKAATWKQILQGRIFDIQVNPQDGKEVIAGGSAGDVAKAFKSGDGGETWVEAYSEAKAQTFVSAVAYQPNSPKTVFLGLSTGEIIQSNNGGTSWNLIAKLEGRILEMQIAPDIASTLYALSFQSGLMRSRDSGRTWENLTDPKSNSALTNIINGRPSDAQPVFSQVSSFQDFVIVASDPSVMYVATGDGLYRSRDRGAVWEKLQLPLHQGDTTIVSAVEVNQKSPSTIYAAVGGTFYKSTDRGSTWKTKALNITSTVRGIIVDQSETNTVYLSLGSVLQ